MTGLKMHLHNRDSIICFDMALGVKDDEQWEFHKAFLEVRSQAPKSPNFTEKFQKNRFSYIGESKRDA